jgi:hypothetical protein
MVAECVKWFLPPAGRGRIVSKGGVMSETREDISFLVLMTFVGALTGLVVGISTW